MKTREIKELKTKSAADLKKLLAENREKLRGLILDLAAGKVKNVSEIHALKKDIARIMTFLNQKHESR